MTGRFAPTPSGRMHIGNVYAMLAAWLSARSQGEHMLLRIEDVDKPRVIAGADQLMMDDLRWLGLDWDNAEPLYQSRNTERYEYALECLRSVQWGDASDVAARLPADAARTSGSGLHDSCKGPQRDMHDAEDVSRGVSQNFSWNTDDVSHHVSRLLPDGVCAEGPQVSDVLYPCFCSRADIRAASAPNEGDGFMVYPGTCRRLLREHPDEVRERLARGDRHSLRIAMPEGKPAPMMHDATLPSSAEFVATMAAAMPMTAGDVSAAGIATATANGPADRKAGHSGSDGIRHDAVWQVGDNGGRPVDDSDGIRGVTAMFDDAVYGPQTYDLPHDIGDSVIRRADGLFGYQLVVVVDDLDMGVDDIVRGRDLLRSTALQMWIRHCLLVGGFKPEWSADSRGLGASSAPDENSPRCETATCTMRANDDIPATMSSAFWPGMPCKVSARHWSSPSAPAYAHLPLIDNAAGRRLAKRERSLDTGALRARGVGPEQIIGYCAWLLRVRPTPEPCTAAELVPDFSWAPLRAAHPDRALDPTDFNTPAWLADALSA